MIITPMSAQNYAINSTNFPCLKRAFTVDSVTTDLISLVDLMGSGLQFDMPGDYISKTATTFEVGTNTTTTPTGTWHAPTTLASLYLAVGSFVTASALTFGRVNASNNGVLLAGDATATIRADATHVAAFAASAITSFGAMGITTNSGGTASNRHVASAAALTTTAGSVTGDVLISPVDSFLSFSGTSINFSGIYQFVFADGLPTNLGAGIAWMSVNPGKVYPGWYKLP